MLRFTKMHGCGNDYVYINAFTQQIDDPNQLSVVLSDRRKGIGGDGIILVCPSDIADAKMRMFNADGSEGKMCGNGIRCVGKYIYDYGIAKKPVVTIETLSGVKTLELTIEDDQCVAARVDMGAPILDTKDIPCILPYDRAIGVETELCGIPQIITAVSMGNPHCVIFTKGIDDLDLEGIGKDYEFAPIFPERVNTEFAEIISPTHLKMRVWERGSGETMACGTGACAVAVAAVENGISPKNEDITVELRGGTLIIRYTDETVYMTGPATKVFEGEIEI